MRKRNLIILLSLAVVFSAFTVWMIWGNLSIQITEYELPSENIPQAFDGFRIAQISDLHNAEFGVENARLLSKLESATPDIIVITGDMIDSRRTDVDVALRFAEKAIQIAPVYYVTGNHESRVPKDYTALKDELIKLGVTVLEDRSVILERDRATVNLIGINDESYWTGYDDATTADTLFNSLSGGKDTYDILLYHRPNYLGLCNEIGIDLILSGHLHGGQFSLPFVGGVYAPSYGLFPEYDRGMYYEGDTAMIVSRGIGNSAFPIRFNNPPELVIVELVAGR